MAENTEDNSSFTQARSDFYDGNYRKALLDVQPALQAMSGSLDVHEFHSLILFAAGDYYRSAAVAHTVLEAGPGWNWDTLQSLYASPDAYTQQLRGLEHNVNEHPDDAGARFLLGYHYAMLGHLSAASHQFERVVKLEPRDKLSAAILANLDQALKAKPQSTPSGTPGSAPNTLETPSTPGVAPAPPEFTEPGETAKPSTTPTQPATATPAAKALLGTWRASPLPGFTIEATLQPDGHFTWKATQGEHNESFAGTYTAEGNSLVLTRTDGQKMDGVITMQGTTGFNFHSKVTPKEDPGLNFAK
jgi:tetratricopeptide (TPR) repeat protein